MARREGKRRKRNGDTQRKETFWRKRSEREGGDEHGRKKNQ